MQDKEGKMIKKKSLSEKRKEIFDIMIKKCPTIAGRIYRIIRQQDADFVKKLKKEWKAKCKRMEVMSGEVADYELKCLLSEIMGEFKNGNNRRRKHT